jgi:hypothetical protein
LAKPRPVFDNLDKIKALHKAINDILVHTPMEDDGTMNEATKRDVRDLADDLRICAEKILMECSNDLGILLQEHGINAYGLQSIEERLSEEDLPDPYAVALLTEVKRLRAWSTFEIAMGMRPENPRVLP